MSFNIVYLGAEASAWRSLLHSSGVTHVGASYWSMRKRLSKRSGGIDFTDWGFDSVLLDSGGHAANRKPDSLTEDGWVDYASEYVSFALAHVEQVSLVTEFDCLTLGEEWIAGQRSRYTDLGEKFCPVWHPEHGGLVALNELGSCYGRVAISGNDIGNDNGRALAPHLNALARDGVELHGVSMTKPTVLRNVQFTTASSTSWLSPRQWGDTQIAVNGEIKRYPKSMKDQARARHAALFTEAGFDAEKIAADDADEVTRLALWSWAQQEQTIRASWGEQSNSSPPPSETPTAPSEENTVGREVDVPADAQVVSLPLQQRAVEDMKHFPVFGITQQETVDPVTQEVTSLPLLEVRGTSSRRCDSCIIAKKCTEFRPNSTCAYSMPTELKTKDQKRALVDGLMAMQAQRVQFMRLSEELNGSYADPNLSLEVDRLLKIVSTQAELEDGRDFFKVSIEGRSTPGGGVLSQLFGAGPAERAKPPMRVLDAEETDVVMQRMVDGKKVTG